MAVFLLNDCKFNGCGLTFKSLGHLIQHIEETHIDYEPHVVEQMELQKPTCIPLSYALRFLTDAARKECAKSANKRSRLNEVNILARATRNRNNAATPTGSDVDEGDEFASEPDDSNDSSTTSEEYSADFILRCGATRVINQSAPSALCNNNNNIVVNNIDNGNNNFIDKPFACPVPGCKKRYKNVNGIKYHSKNGHKKDGKIRKAFRCPCGKSYKTPSGLKNHTVIQHAGTMLQNGKPGGSMKYDNRTNNHQQRETLSKHTGATGGSAIAVKIGKSTFANKAKVAAIEDHGYIKSEKSIYTDTIRDCEQDEELGILTPASTPPLPTSHQSPPAKNYATLPAAANQDRTLQKYLANVVASAAHCNNQQSRNIVDNDNAY